MTATEYNYYRHEIKKLGDPEDCRLKIKGDLGETRWLIINRDQLDRITEILAEDTD